MALFDLVKSTEGMKKALASAPHRAGTENANTMKSACTLPIRQPENFVGVVLDLI